MRSFCIATWNLNNVPLNGRRAEAAHTIMAGINADVWILTEIRKDFSPGEDYTPVAESAGETKDCNNPKRWVTIWARKPLASFCIPTNDVYRTACAHIRLANKEDLIVYGTVLPWLGSTWNNKNSKGGEAFIAALENQALDWEKLQCQYLQTMLCVAGDFNQDLRNDGYFYGSKVQRSELQRVLSQKQLKCYTGGAVDPVAKCAPGSYNIDHICLSHAQGLSDEGLAWSGTREGTKISDHFGVSVRFSG